MASRVPKEIWLEIFKDLPKDALLHVLRTDRLFRAISIRRHVFATFEFHSDGCSPEDVDRRSSFTSTELVERALERLEF